MVIVHENKEILTHNSRRYMVVCTFMPEIYSLTASVAVPNHLLKKFFDRIREKQFQLSLGQRSETANAATDRRMENRTFTTTGSNEKATKSKRFSLRRHELRPALSQQSHLRDSIILAEDRRAKWLKQSSHIQGDNGQWPMRSLLEGNKMAIVSVLALCTIGLICLILLVKLRCQTDIFHTANRRRHLSCQQVSSMEKGPNQVNIISL